MRLWGKLVLGIWAIICGITVPADDTIRVKAIVFFISGALLLASSVINRYFAEGENIKQVYAKTDSLGTQLISLGGVLLCIFGTIGVINRSLNWDIIYSLNKPCYVRLAYGFSFLSLCEIFHFIDYNYTCYLCTNPNSETAGKVWDILGIVICFAVALFLTTRIAGKHNDMSASQFAEALERANARDFMNKYRFQKWGAFFSLLVSMLLLSRYWKAIIISSVENKKIISGIVAFAVSLGLSVLFTNGLLETVTKIMEIVTVIVGLGVIMLLFSKGFDGYSKNLEKRVNNALALGRSDSGIEYLTEMDLYLYNTIHAGEAQGFAEKFASDEAERRNVKFK